MTSETSVSSDSSINTYTENSPANESYNYAEPMSNVDSTSKFNSADISHLQLKHSQAAHILTNDNESIEEGEKEEE